MPPENDKFRDRTGNKSTGHRRVKCTFKQTQLGRGLDDGTVVPFTADLSNGPGGSFAGKVRYSARATKVRLIIDERGVMIVVPQKRSRYFKFKLDLDEILDRNLEWILQGLMKFQLREQLRGKSIMNGEFPSELPTSIFLPALGETWIIQEIPSQNLKTLRAGRISFELDRYKIYLPSYFSHTESLSALRNWLKRRAQDTLTPLLLQLASEQGLHVEKVFVKDLKSRWGSCSTRNNINLSSRLLFLAPDLVRHVMFHELCHMYEMNHGPAFYARLCAMDPDAERHRAELKSGWLKVPPWASEPL